MKKKKKKEQRNFYNLSLLRDWFPINLANGTKIDKYDLEVAYSQVAYYDFKDGGSGKSKEYKKACTQIRTEAKIYNRLLRQREEQ
ncbi:MAG: hypothetical protein AAF443_08315, partial [Chlamydiota bacterium]